MVPLGRGVTQRLIWHKYLITGIIEEHAKEIRAVVAAALSCAAFCYNTLSCTYYTASGIYHIVSCQVHCYCDTYGGNGMRRLP